ncbi:MAG: putative toxin-antitoxin system toxin component, PIN family [Bacteroidia bacterium]|nr:putative toxin-antitoxin system toxin component, PIN family [Bacteroidia bacterium]
MVDTNIWVSFLAFKGKLDALFERLLALDASIFISNAILHEFQSVLSGKLKLPAEFIAESSTHISVLAQTAELQGPPVTVCRDPNDNHVLQLCREVHADFLLTGDKDLLVLERFEATRIVNPTTLAQSLSIS